MTEKEQKQQLSIAYVHAVASRVGYACQVQIVDDDSVDVTLAAKGWIHQRSVVRSPRLELQLKATSQEVMKGNQLAFRLPRKNYEELRQSGMIPRLLVVLLLPSEPKSWLEQTEDALILRRGAYWCSLRGSPEVETKTVTVHLPRANLFSADQLRALMESASRKEAR